MPVGDVKAVAWFNPSWATTDWRTVCGRTVCGRTARTVRREGKPSSIGLPYLDLYLRLHSSCAQGELRWQKSCTVLPSELCVSIDSPAANSTCIDRGIFN